MNADDTIFAIASGSGVSAVSVVRLSGPRALPAIKSLAGRVGEPRQLKRVQILDPSSGVVLDEALAVWMPAPRSYTGEDSAEFHIHGSRAVQAAVLSALSQLPGLRLAEPGEFTRRAVLNGKLDLVAAEGLGDLLHAKTERQRRQAMFHASGETSAGFDSWRERLISIRADVEAAIDFADEDGVAEVATILVNTQTERLIQDMQSAVDRSRSAVAIRDGIHVVIAGHPNTGKSSLFNVLVGRQAAIVAELPGTTRDVIEVLLDFGGFPVLLKDTAGIRNDPADVVEAEGVARSQKEIGAADLVIWVSSSDVPGSERLDGWLPDLVVHAKCDHPDSNLGLIRNDLGEVPRVAVSSRTLEGINELTSLIQVTLAARFDHEEPSLVVSERQRDITAKAIAFLKESLTPDLPFELKASAVQSASSEIGRITGRTDVEEWLGEIFGRFCIGK